MPSQAFQFSDTFPTFEELFAAMPSRTPVRRVAATRARPVAHVWNYGVFTLSDPTHAGLNNPTIHILIGSWAAYQTSDTVPTGYTHVGTTNLHPTGIDNMGGRSSAQAIEERARLDARRFASNRHFIGAFGDGFGEYGGGIASGFHYCFGLGATFQWEGHEPVQVGYNPDDVVLCTGDAEFVGITNKRAGVYPNLYQTVPGTEDTPMYDGRRNPYCTQGIADLKLWWDSFIDEMQQIRTVLPVHYPAGYMNDVEDEILLRECIHRIVYINDNGPAQEGYSATPTPNVRGFSVPGYVRFNALINMQNAMTMEGDVTARFSETPILFQKNRTGAGVSNLRPMTFEQFLEEAQRDGVWDGELPINYNFGDSVFDRFRRRLETFEMANRNHAWIEGCVKPWQAVVPDFKLGDYNHCAWNPAHAEAADRAYTTDRYWTLSFSQPTTYVNQEYNTASASVSAGRRQELLELQDAIFAKCDPAVECIPWVAMPVTNGAPAFKWGDQDFFLASIKRMWDRNPNIKQFAFWYEDRTVQSGDAFLAAWAAFQTYVAEKSKSVPKQNPAIVLKRRKAAFLRSEFNDSMDVNPVS